MLSPKQEKKYLETILSISKIVKEIDQKMDYIIQTNHDDYYSNAYRQYYKNYGRYLNGKENL